MSLLVWLPLNGNLKNQGLSNISFREYHAVGSTAIQCSASGGKVVPGVFKRVTPRTDDYIISNESISLAGDVTMCCWVNVKELSDAGTANGIFGQHGHQTGGLGITMKDVSSSDFRMSVNTGLYGDSHGSSSDRTFNRYYGSTNIRGAWHHLCLTYQSSSKTLRMYVDGKPETITDGANGATYSALSLSGNNTTARPIVLFAWSTDHLGSGIPYYRPSCDLNDVRVYDHCLNPREVKEVAKGLIAHYQMNIPKARNYVEGQGFHVYNNYGVSSSIVATGETYRGYPVYRLTQTPTDASVGGFRTELYSHGVYQSADMGFALTESAKWSYWLYARPVSHPATTRIGGTASNTGGWTESAPVYQGDGWYRVGQTRTATADRNDAIYTSYYTTDAQAGVPIVVDFCGPHLLKGTNHVFDNYDKYISDSRILEDVSGYGNNLIISGDVIPYSGSPRYNSCLNFNQSGFFYKDDFKMTTTDFTISFWLNPPYTINAQHFLIGTFDIWTGNGFGCWRDSTGGNYSTLYKVDGANSHTGLPGIGATHDTWQHIAYVRSGTQGIYYKNGVEVSRVTGPSGNIWHPVLYLGRSQYSAAASQIDQASISDFRFYSTALSAADVKELYNTPVSLTKNGVLMANEFVENNTNSPKINKTGVVNASNFSNKHALVENMKIKALPDGSSWARIHHLDVRGAGNYFSTAEVADCDKPGKYSKMNKVTNFKDASGKYEFMLTYPTIKKYVPAGYTLLDCIEATGSQYIRTGVTGKARWELDIQFTNTTTRQLMGYGGSSDEYWGCQADGTYGLFSGNMPSAKAGGRDSIVFDGETSKLYAQNSSMSACTTDVSSKEYQIFAIGGGYLCKAKLFRCKAIKGTSLVRDFIPVRRNSDSAVGLYDLVEGKFYGNSGSGVFLAHTIDKYIPIQGVAFTGLQYVDLGVYPKPTLRTQIKFMPHGNIGGVIFGCIERPADGSSADINDYRLFNAGGYCYLDFPGSNRLSGGSIAANKIHELEVGNFYVKDLKTNTNIVSGSGFSFQEQPISLKLFKDIGEVYYCGAVYYLRIWDEHTLIRDFIPVISTLHKQAGLFDRVENKFYPSATKTRLRALGVPPQEDSPYEFLNYLRSTGTQYINTGIVPNNNTRIVVDAILETNHSIYGVSDSGCNFNMTGGGDQLYYYWNNGGASPRWSYLNQRHQYEQDKNICRIDGTLVHTYTNTSWSASSSMLLFARNHNTSGPNDMGTCRIYQCDIYDNGALVRSFYPAKRKSDGVLGMYDSVTNNFYTNAGSGTFYNGGTASFAPVVLPEEIPLYNRWVQDSWTTDVNAGDSIGFRKVFTSWPAHNGPIKPANSTTDTVYDCDVVGTGNWYAPVGQLKVWSGGIPAADGNAQKETELWVRFDNHPSVNTAAIQKYGSVAANNFMEI